MSKRKEAEMCSKVQTTPSKRKRREQISDNDATTLVPDTLYLTPSKIRVDVEAEPFPSQKSSQPNLGDVANDELQLQTSGNRGLLRTPKRSGKIIEGTPSRRNRADQSAKRKSTQALLDIDGQDDWDRSAALAREILDNDENVIESMENQETNLPTASAISTPSKQGRGRPKGAKNKRSPTPEGDLPPEERYFFQNRMGIPKVSSNIFTSLGLLTHDEYFELMRDFADDHKKEQAYLLRLHTRSFPQWKFELEEAFGLCLYGYGSKRKLVNNFIEWLYPKFGPHHKVVILNGYTPRINIRSVLHTIASALIGPDEQLRLVGQPHDMTDAILSYLDNRTASKLVLVVNSIDSAALRRMLVQSILAKMAAHPQISFIATADTPTFPVLWNSAIKDQFRFLFHDCTTFAPYEVEINAVDDVNDLLGRKNRRVGGKEGVGFVLQSLPENARSLYRVLLTEVLSLVNETVDGLVDNEDGEETHARRAGGENAEEIGIEYRSLYQKASEEFICSSDMNFRFLLKEFHDHQMLTSKRDASGTELLGVPLSKEEMEAVLEDLVLG